MNRLRLMIASAVLVAVNGCAAIGATSTGGPARSSSSPPDSPTEIPSASTQPGPIGWYGGTLVWAMSCPAIRPDGGTEWAGTPFANKLHELILPEGYRVNGSNPFQLLGADGQVVATEGDAIKVEGAIPTTVSSFCSIGPQVIVRELKVDGAWLRKREPLLA